MIENTVDEYIAECPLAARDKLETIRSMIKSIAPRAKERTDYFGIPGYSYDGYDYDGMFAWFSYKTPYIRIHVRPPVLQKHEVEIAGYRATKAIVSFPENKDIPLDLIAKLVNASIEVMKSK